MGDILAFPPRARSHEPASAMPLAGGALRASLEEAAQTALDAADRIIAVLDRMDGDADHEDGGDVEPSLAAPENHAGSRGVYMRGNDQDREAEAPETVLPVMTVVAVAETAADVIEVEPLRWGGNGNVLALAGATVLDFSSVAGGALLAFARGR